MFPLPSLSLSFFLFFFPCPFFLSFSSPPPPPFFSLPLLWFIRPSSLVLSFVTVFDCIAFLYMLFPLTEWAVSSFMHYPSMFLGILSARCSSIWLVKMSFPVRYCYCLIYKVLFFPFLFLCLFFFFLGMDSIVSCIKTKSVADLILPRECSLSLKLSLSFSLIVIYILWLLIFFSTSNISARFLHLLLYFEMASLAISMIWFTFLSRHPLLLTRQKGLPFHLIPSASHSWLKYIVWCFSI